VREKSRPVSQVSGENRQNKNQCPRIKILTPSKSKENVSFADKVLSPLRKDKISL
jgi:hypothetical protein